MLVASACVASLALSAWLYVNSANSARQEATGGQLILDWDYRPSGLEDLVDRADATLVGSVVSVRSGEPIVIDAENGVEIPTELVEVRVDELLAGKAPESLVLQRLGGNDLESPDDPGYAEGGRYLLFLSAPDATDPSNGEGAYSVTAPDGRFQERQDGSLAPAIGGPIASEFAGRDMDGATQRIEQVRPAEKAPE